MKQRLSFLIPLVMGCSLAACDNDYGSVDKDPYPANVPLSGIWTGSYTITPADTTQPTQTVNVQMVGSEANEFWIIEGNTTLMCSTIGYGQAHSIQSNLTGSYGWGATCTFPDGSNQGNATLSGTATLHDTLNLTFNKFTAKGTAVATFTPAFTFEGAIYLQASSLATVAGSYTDGTSTVSIDASGKITEAVVPGSSCSGSGSVSVINSNYNLYRVQFTFANCTADADKTLNNVTVTGLGYLDNTKSTPAEFIATFQGTDTTGTPIVDTIDLVTS